MARNAATAGKTGASTRLTLKTFKPGGVSQHIRAVQAANPEWHNLDFDQKLALAIAAAEKKRFKTNRSTFGSALVRIQAEDEQAAAAQAKKPARPKISLRDATRLARVLKAIRELPDSALSLLERMPEIVARNVELETENKDLRSKVDGAMQRLQ